MSLSDTTIFDCEKKAVNLLDNAFGKHGIYVATDWHIFDVSHDGQHNNIVRKDYHRLLNAVNTKLTEDDVLIYLGDLTGTGVAEKFDYVKDIVSKLRCHKIMICGNNDLMGFMAKDSDIPFRYLEAGFDSYLYALVWHDILFTHCPIENNAMYNIHGHLHTGEPYSHDEQYWKIYGIRPSNHINAYNKVGRPIALNDLIKGGVNFNHEWDTAVIDKEPNFRTEHLIKETVREYQRLSCTQKGETA